MFQWLHLDLKQEHETVVSPQDSQGLSRSAVWAGARLSVDLYVINLIIKGILTFTGGPLNERKGMRV